MLYRVVTQSPAFDSFRDREMILRYESAFSIEHLGKQVVLNPDRVVQYVRSKASRIIEAIDMTKRVITEIQDYCKDNELALHVAIFPVRENVFFSVDEELFPKEALPVTRRLAEYLHDIRTELIAFLYERGVPTTDLIEPMANALENQMIYPTSDGHPNGLGYRVIAESLKAEIGSN